MTSQPSAGGPETGPDLRSGSRRRGGDVEIAELATRQRGLITLSQLVDLGLGKDAVHKRIRAGRMHPVFQRVYAVGHMNLTREGRWFAAVLACGGGAVLSHRSAAALWGIRPERSAAIDVTAPNRRGRQPAGIAAHRNGALPAADLACVRGIPCTGVARTLLDLAGIERVKHLEGAIAEAQRRGVFDLSECLGLIGRSRGRRGVAVLRGLISELDPNVARTRSELERMFLALCRQAGVPPPQVNYAIDVSGGTVLGDFVWPDRRWVVETDGRETHGTPSAFESDRLRDQRLNVAGWHVLRCTWLQVESKASELRQTLRTLIGHYPPTGRKAET